MAEDWSEKLDEAQRAVDSGEYATAEELFKLVAASSEHRAAAQRGLGDLFSETGRPEEAVEAFKAAIESNPEDGESFLALGRELLGLAKLHGAERSLMHGLLLEGGVDAPADDWYNLALCLHLQHRSHEAIPFVRQALKLNTEADGEHLYADCLYNCESYSEALSHYRAALVKDPTNADIMANLGFTLEMLCSHQEALSYLEQAEPFKREEAEIYASLSRCHQTLGHLDDAAEAAERYQELAIEKEHPQG